MLDAAIHEKLAVPLDRAAIVLARFGVSANSLSLIGFIAGLLGAAFIANNSYLSGLAFLTAFFILDGLDGPVARRTRETVLGAFYDMCFFPIIAAAVPFAFALARQNNILAANFMLLGMVLQVAAIMAYRVQAIRQAGLPGARPMPQPMVLCERTETYLVFLAMCVLSILFSPLAFLYGIACFVTVGMQIAVAVTNFGSASRS